MFHHNSKSCPSKNHRKTAVDYHRQARDVYRQVYLAEAWKHTAKSLSSLKQATDRYGRRDSMSQSEYVGEIKSHLVTILNQYRRVLPTRNNCFRIIRDYLKSLQGDVNPAKAKELLHSFTLATLHRV